MHFSTQFGMSTCTFGPKRVLTPRAKSHACCMSNMHVVYLTCYDVLHVDNYYMLIFLHVDHYSMLIFNTCQHK